jgi:hypothetical protein
LPRVTGIASQIVAQAVSSVAAEIVIEAGVVVAQAQERQEKLDDQKRAAQCGASNEQSFHVATSA